VPGSGGTARKRARATGADKIGKESVAELVREVRKEMGGSDDGNELHFEIVATVLEVFARMDSLFV